jgi:hypothetical protein
VAVAAPRGDAPIIGPRTLEQLEECVRATEITIDDDSLKAINEIFPASKSPKGLRLVKFPVIRLVKSRPGSRSSRS